MQGTLVSLSIMSWDGAPSKRVVLTGRQMGLRASTSWSQGASLSIGSGGLGVTGGPQGREGETPIRTRHGDIFEDEIDSCFRIKSELTSSDAFSLDHPTPSTTQVTHTLQGIFTIYRHAHLQGPS